MGAAAAKLHFRLLFGMGGWRRAVRVCPCAPRIKGQRHGHQAAVFGRAANAQGTRDAASAWRSVCAGGKWDCYR
uniref:Uncharacterized protein n=1 Tax=Siphoviridae sp. ctEeW6 TaxID=2827816 RepID=A0A8S5T1W4_9CAUD|nr:MAG TPA: hypothetical protein [Siphoviridae sp. ctEeW6]